MGLNSTNPESEQRAGVGDPTALLEYKRTDAGVVPAEWDLQPLLRVLQIATGQIDPKREPYRSMILIAPDHIESGTGRLLDQRTASEQGAISGKYLFSSGDIVYSKIRPYLRKAILADFDGLCSADMYPLTPADGVDPTYMLAVLLGHRFSTFAESISVRSGIPKINRAELADFVVAVPQSDEQRAIGEALSDADKLIGALDKLIAKKRVIKQAAMHQLLTGKTRLPGFTAGWVHTTLGEVVEHCSSGATPYRERPEYFRGSIRWITSGELNYKRIYDTHEHISEEAVCDTNLRIHPPGTFLMAITGLEAEGTRGSCGIVGAEATTNQSCMSIYPSPRLLSSYLFHFYVYRGKSLALQYCQGTKQQSYTASTVRSLPIHMPTDIKEQQAIVAVLSDIDTEIEALERRYYKAKQIKQGMMQQLLTGRVRLVKSQSSAMQTETDAKTSKPHSRAFNEAVIIAMLTKHFGTEEFPLGRKRYTKLAYLLHRRTDGQVEDYLKKAAGPYNPKTKYGGSERIALESGYIREHKQGPYSGFIAADNVAKAEDYFEKWYGPDAIKWLKQFRQKKNDDLELLATVDLVAEELRAAGKDVSVDGVKNVIRNHQEWHAKLNRPIFSDVNIAKAIETCRKLFG